MSGNGRLTYANLGKLGERGGASPKLVSLLEAQRPWRRELTTAEFSEFWGRVPKEGWHKSELPRPGFSGMITQFGDGAGNLGMRIYVNGDGKQEPSYSLRVWMNAPKWSRERQMCQVLEEIFGAYAPLIAGKWHEVVLVPETDLEVMKARVAKITRMLEGNDLGSWKLDGVIELMSVFAAIQKQPSRGIERVVDELIRIESGLSNWISDPDIALVVEAIPLMARLACCQARN